MDNRVIFFTGYPGSGKGTQAKIIAEELKIVHLSTGELFRRESMSGSELGKQMAYYMNQGLIIPENLTFQYLERELSKTKYRKGFILDGYPKDLRCCIFMIETLRKLQFIPFLALHFDLSRIEVENRLSGRLHCVECESDYHVTKVPPKKRDICDYCGCPLESRMDDTIDSIRKRLDVFEQRTNPVLGEFEKLGIYERVDANESVANVTVFLLESIWNKHRTERSGAYFLRPPMPAKYSQSEKFHNHIDAKDETLLKEIVTQIENGEPDFWNRIYPIAALSLGPQVNDHEYEHMYRSLPNFHEIDEKEDGRSEAFSTGKMGDNSFNYSQIHKTLAVCTLYKGQGVMTELEQQIWSSEGQQLEEDQDDQDDQDDEKREASRVGLIRETKDMFREYEMYALANVPKFELHHGFDMEKREEDRGEGPIKLDRLVELSKNLGFNVGGWFIFKKEKTWSYRCNEFSNEAYQECLKKLEQQATKMKALLTSLLDRQFSYGYSLENVIAIWEFS